MKITLLLTGCVSAIIAGGCSGADSSNAASEVNTGVAIRPNNTATNAVSNDASVVTNTNTNASQGSFADKSNRANLGNKATSGTPPPLQYKAADEDSEIATLMNGEGQPVQIRVFKSHPKLAKVESIWQDAKLKNLKISLRDGQVIEVKTDKIGDLKFATAAAILEIAGI